jgi:uncharacterized membrane protein SpoIIM required for sporulation
MLAEEHDFPREMISYLQGLVSRAHNTVYCASGFDARDWGRALFQTAPRRLRSDFALRLATGAFWSVFLIAALLAAGREPFAQHVLGPAFLELLDHMYAEPVGSPRHDGFSRSDTMMAGFYIQHNTSIGLRCFAWGIVFGLGSLYELIGNAAILGSVFGHMAVGPHAGNFLTFVTAHSSFELTAIIVSAAAGLRLGWGLIDTQGMSRMASLRREALAALPALGAAVVLFVLAAFVEGYISASNLPYAVKAQIAILGAGVIIAYIALGGREPARPGDPIGSEHVRAAMRPRSVTLTRGRGHHS